MSTEEHKPVDLSQEEAAAPVPEPVVAESAPAPVAETAAPAPAVVEEPAPAEPLAADATTTTAAAAEVPAESSKPEEDKKEDKKEEPKEELKPVEEGVLEHRKASGGFPKNLIYTKQTFWFGVEPVENKSLASYIKGEKATETAFHNAAWATKTGSGLLFYGDKKDAISGVINLADSTEPEADGYAKFHFTCKGVKHTFKAPTKLDRDSWVAQLKSKIADAKETISTVTESEEYKNAVETLKKPAIKKEDKSAEAPVDEAKKEDVVAAGAEELPKDGHKEVDPVAADELAKHDDKKEEPKSEEDTKVDDLKEPKRRSTSRKRLSVFNFKGKGKKGEEKKEEASPTESAPAPSAVEAAAVPAVAEATPVIGQDHKPTEEAPAVSDGAVGAPVTAEEAAVVTPAAAATATEDKAAEEKTGEEKAVKPTPTKRNSFFDVFKSKKAAAPVSEPVATPEEVAETETAPIAPVTEVAPVIPPVDTATVPLPTAEEANPASPPVEGSAEEPAASTSTPAEKKEMASDKRKSSMPFSLGKKDKSPSSPEEPVEKDRASPSLFSRFRKTIKGRPEKTDKSAEKSDEKADETQAAAATGAPTEETPAPAAAVADPLVEEAPAAVHEPEPIKSELPIAAPVGSAVA